MYLVTSYVLTYALSISSRVQSLSFFAPNHVSLSLSLLSFSIYFYFHRLTFHLYPFHHGVNRGYFHQEWIRDLFDNVTFAVTTENESPPEVEWRIGEKISERAILHVDFFEDLEDTAEAVVVYHCTQVKGPDVGKEAILKMRLHYPASPKWKVRRMFATKQPSENACNEMDFLEYLARKGSKVTAKPLHILRTKQAGKYTPVPGGWMVLMIMENLPGVPLVDYRYYSPGKREKIRGAFRESLTELYNLRIIPVDEHLGNLLYDEKENKCWFVDYESFYEKRDGPPRKFYDGEYVAWHMADRNAKGEVVFY